MGNFLPFCCQDDEKERLHNKVEDLQRQLDVLQTAIVVRKNPSRTVNGTMSINGPRAKPKFSMAKENKAILKTVFDRMDKDHNGKVNIRELIIGLRKDAEAAELLHMPMHVHDKDRHTLMDRFREMDLDGSSDVDFEEFCAYFGKDKKDYDTFMFKKIHEKDAMTRAFVTGAHDAQTIQLQRVFHKLKGDCDYIDVSKFPSSGGNQALTTFFKMIGTGKNKHITYEEFVVAGNRVAKDLNGRGFTDFVKALCPDLH